MKPIERLRQLIFEHSFKYSEEPVFQLASGKKSKYYVNLKTVSWSAEGAELIGMLIFEKIKDLPIEAVGGLTAGADPLAMAVVMESLKSGGPVNGFSVRKEPKGHGLKKLVEGAVAEGDKVAILEDVITTGGSTVKAIERAEDQGLDVELVIAVVDREEGGRKNIEAAGYKVDSLVTLSELMELVK
jgi:orotate phosphoribosyltransferase